VTESEMLFFSFPFQIKMSNFIAFVGKCGANQKLQSFVLALRLFGAKILYEKRTHKTLMKLTVGGST